ncbi:glycosyl hydrolase-like protein [Leishmania mexicana MHOM/GT/2001/U1103]|uniref:Glycosyl hydrolase-like protein n=1 Tax=Leishmania mexicana (strain MHOM/GT/2001/U1103) TaxID=929439 RepID=E9ATJ3_LEIMU|nr:glycosyl hydrolase-like protein [Leishmania mexicana MHOM/GT/2001/U1103]CBZ26267.1 glycosyl hydrolase-like protein [Leishmania mexicana MHOM/GT/2001/U1103]
MAKRPFGSHGVRYWRTRRLLLRIPLALAVLVGVSLVVVLWLSAYENTGVTEILSERHFFPPAKHGAKDEGKEVHAYGESAFRRPSSVSTTTRTPAEETPNGVDAVWFSPNTRNSLDRNTSWLQSVFTSAGRVRVALPFGVHADTGAFVAQKPRLFAFIASWSTYGRALMARGAQGNDTAAVSDIDEELQIFARRRVVPVKHVEVRLLRQRRSRSTWANETETTLPIVGILPRESTTLVSAEELLVKSAVDQEGLAPLVAAVQPGSDNKESTVVGIDTRLRVSAAKRFGGGANHDAGDSTSLLPFPLLELSSVPRRRATSPDSATPASPDTSPATALLKWRTSRTTAPASSEALEITLDIAHPSRSSLNAPLRAEEDEKMRPGARDDTYAAALEATVCSARLVRLYGFSPSFSPAQTHGGSADVSAAVAAGGLNLIPLNMSEEVELMVGGEMQLLSGGARLSGLVPLVYLELSDKSAAGAQQGAAIAGRQTVGLLWLHPGSFFVSTLTLTDPTGDHKPLRTCVRLRGTAGATGLYLLPGPTAVEVLRQYYTLTGFPTLPPRFLLGYHHGLRGAVATTQQAAEELSEAFRSSGAPLDSVWITDPAVAAGDTPFTWNHTRFPDPLALQSNLWYRGRRYVVLRSVPTVPITTRSPLLLEGRRGGLFVSLSAADTAGWPVLSVDGVPSHVVDFFNPTARKWYGGMLKYRRYVGSSNHTFINLQHSAPTVLSNAAPAKVREELLCLPPGVRASGEQLPMDVGHYGGVHHRQVHQLLTVQFARATHDGMLRRTRYHRRALTFAESYFVGTQRYAVVRVETRPRCASAVRSDSAAILTEAWRALQTAVHQCTQLGVLGIPFSGANLADGLASRLLLLQLAKSASTTATLTAPLAGVAGEGGGDGAVGVNDELTAPPASSPGAMEEMEQLLVRWYQAGVFFGAMYADESAPAVETTGTGVVVSLRSSSTGPWWMRLPVAAATRQAINANLHVRYAFLPYLYTAAYHASEEGAIFLAPLAFTSSEASPLSQETTMPTCYAAGSALIVCPVTQPVHPPRDTSRSNGTRSADCKGFFDLWTGVWHSTVSSGARHASWWEGAAQYSAQNRALASKELGWLATNDAVSLQDLPVAASLAPVLLRSGHIVATQNVFSPRVNGTHVGDDKIVGDAHALHSTHVGANWTLTVALPPLPAAEGAVATSPVLLAEGDVFWDEGSHNSQHQPPTMKPGSSVLPDMPYIPSNVHHCALHVKCLYEAAEPSEGTARLTVEVTQTSESCAEALAELVSHWNAEPQGFAERLANAKADRDARLHRLQVEQNEQEDKGMRGGRGGAKDSPDASTFTGEDLRGLHLPNAQDEATRNKLWTSYLLQRLRFLFQCEEDAARLSPKSSTSRAMAVVVERRSRTGGTPGAQADEDSAVRASVRASHDMSDAHAVLVHLISDVQDEGAGGSVFGARKVVLPDGFVSVRVPPHHTWRFTFSLMN